MQHHAAIRCMSENVPCLGQHDGQWSQHTSCLTIEFLVGIMEEEHLKEGFKGRQCLIVPTSYIMLCIGRSQTPLQRRSVSSSPFYRDWETEAQSEGVTCPQSPNRLVGESELEPGSLDTPFSVLFTRPHCFCNKGVLIVRNLLQNPKSTEVMPIYTR